MLKIGQIHKNAKRFYKDGTTGKCEIAGKIGRITGYEGKHPSIKDNISPRVCTRIILHPIDDEPCDSEFLADFKKEIVNETVN